MSQGSGQQNILLPGNIRNALIGNPSNPSTLNYFVTLADLIGTGGIYGGSGNVPTTTVATLADNLTFTGGTTNFTGATIGAGANTVVMRNSSSQIIFQAKNNRDIQMGGHASVGNGSVATANTIFRAVETHVAAGTKVGINSSINMTASIAGVYAAIGSQNASSVSGTNYSAGSFALASQNYVFPLGVSGSVNLDAYASQNTIFNTIGSVSTWKDVYGSQSSIGLPLFAAGTMTFTNGYNFHVRNATGGTINATNIYGLYIEDLTRATNNYGVVSMTPLNGFGIAAPTAVMHVVGKNITTDTDGSNIANTVIGTDPLTFSVFGDLTTFTTTGSFDAFGGYFNTGPGPAFQAQVYDNTTFVENGCVFVGVDDFSGTDRPYASMYYTEDNAAFTGFQADISGEQLYTQRLGVVSTTLTAADRVLFTNTTGYIKATTFANLATLLGVVAPVAITDDIIPRGTGTTIEDGTWSNVGTAIYPETTGSNIGDAAHRIGTIFMSSVIDYASSLNFTSSATTFHTFDTIGNLDLIKSGAGIATIGTVASGFFKLNVENNILVKNTSGNAEIEIQATTGQAFVQINNLTANLDSYMHFANLNANKISLGWDDSADSFKMGTLAIGTGTWYEYNTTTQNARHTANLGIGLVTPSSTQKVIIKGTGSTFASYGLTVQNLGAFQTFAVRDDGLAQINTLTTTTPFSGTTLTLNVARTYTGTGIATSHANTFAYNPVASVATTIRGIANRTEKLGAFNAGTVYGITGESRQSGSGTVAAMSGLHGFFWSTGSGAITTAFGIRAQAQIQGLGTVTDFGGLEVVLGQNAVGTTITNMYGILVNTPSSTGGAVTNTYGLRLDNNTLGATQNWGLFVEGSTRQNFIEGSLSVGASAAHASAAFEITSTTKGMRLTPMTATEAAAITVVEGLMVFVSNTDATFTSVGYWGYESGAWTKL